MQENFKYLDDLIHCGDKLIVLTSDIVLDDGEECEYPEGIKIDVDNLIIDAKGFTIDACGKTRIFYNTADNVTIKNALLKNAAGAIYNFRGFLNISNSILLSNTADVAGGALYNNWGEVNVCDCLLYDNTSKCHGGAIFNVNGTVNIKKSRISFNDSQNDGGAIFNGAKLNIEDCILCYNKAKGSGGAVYDNRGEINIEKSLFSNNRSKGIFGGGAIHKNRGVLNIVESSLTNNGADADGGAIFSIDGDLTVFKSVFSNNASRDCGGAIYDWGVLSIESCGLCENAADKDGGAIYSKNKSDFRVDACNFNGNFPNDFSFKN